MTSDAVVRGQGCRLLLSVEGYEFPDADDFDDANWLIGSVELEAGTTGSFRAFHRVTFRADELAQFRDELRPIADTLNGEATLRLRAAIRDLDSLLSEFPIRGEA
jgi:hypothetical protein